MWIDYKKDYNCVHETVFQHGSLTLREVADRLGVSFVRVKQIEDKAREKLKNSLSDY
jgi:DNA-directed RNA polymerase specialized sigma subunit